MVGAMELKSSTLAHGERLVRTGQVRSYDVRGWSHRSDGRETWQTWKRFVSSYGISKKTLAQWLSILDFLFLSFVASDLFESHMLTALRKLLPA